MKKIICLLAITLAVIPVIAAEKNALHYTVSKTDINRIICPDPIREVIFSEEKGLTSKVVGNEVFIKFPVTITVNPETMEKTTMYGSGGGEVFLVCGETTYNLVLTPANIPSQTVEIKPAKEKVLKEYKGKDIEEILGGLMTLAIEDDIPEGAFQKQDKNSNYTVARQGGNLTVVYRKSWTGGGYVIKEYHIFSDKEISLLPLELMSFPEVIEPLAITLTSEKFRGWSRGFIIEASK